MPAEFVPGAGELVALPTPVVDVELDAGPEEFAVPKALVPGEVGAFAAEENDPVARPPFSRDPVAPPSSDPPNFPTTSPTERKSHRPPALVPGR